MSIFDFKRKKYRTFLQDSETGEEITEEYEKGRGVWKKHDVQDGKGSEMRENLIRKHYWFSGRVQGVGNFAIGPVILPVLWGLPVG